jgi:hypothetical protein
VDGLYGGKRPKELTYAKTSDYVLLPNGNIQGTINVECKNNKSGDHTYIIPDSPDPNSPAKIFKQYMQMLPVSDHQRMWCQWDKKRKRYTKNQIGKNKVTEFPARIARLLVAPNSDIFKGKSFRRSAATLLAMRGISVFSLQSFGRWKAIKSAQAYIDSSVKMKQDNATMLMGPPLLPPHLMPSKPAVAAALSLSSPAHHDAAPPSHSSPAAVAPSLSLESPADAVFSSPAAAPSLSSPVARAAPSAAKTISLNINGVTVTIS